MQEVVFKPKDMFPCKGDNLWISEGFSIWIRMESLLEDHIVVIDFDGIRRVSRGFASEIIGNLIRNNRTDLIDHIKFINTNKDIEDVITWVKEHPEDAINWL